MGVAHCHGSTEPRLGGGDGSVACAGKKMLGGLTPTPSTPRTKKELGAKPLTAGDACIAAMADDPEPSE